MTRLPWGPIGGRGAAPVGVVLPLVGTGIHRRRPSAVSLRYSGGFFLVVVETVLFFLGSA
jgi:hypothetical protein